MDRAQAELNKRYALIKDSASEVFCRARVLQQLPEALIWRCGGVLSAFLLPCLLEGSGRGGVVTVLDRDVRSVDVE